VVDFINRYALLFRAIICVADFLDGLGELLAIDCSIFVCIETLKDPS
jgi:hypothetical protein